MAGLGLEPRHLRLISQHYPLDYGDFNTTVRENLWNEQNFEHLWHITMQTSLCKDLKAVSSPKVYCSYVLCANKVLKKALLWILKILMTTIYAIKILIKFFSDCFFFFFALSRSLSPNWLINIPNELASRILRKNKLLPLINSVKEECLFLSFFNFFKRLVYETMLQ